MYGPMSEQSEGLGTCGSASAAAPSVTPRHVPGLEAAEDRQKEAGQGLRERSEDTPCGG